MTEEKNICNDNERKTVGGEKETEASFQVQKQSKVEKEKSDTQLLPTFEKQSSKINIDSSYTLQNWNSCVPKLNGKITRPAVTVTHLFRAISVAIFGVLAKLSCYFGYSASMSRGCLRLSGIWSVVGVVVLLVGWVGGSEFPERECCDPVYPPNTATTAAAPITPPIPKLTGQCFV